MPFTTPPTFADGNTLTATQLNNLSDNLEFLNGLVASGINTPFNSLASTVDLTSSNNQWLIYHLHQYLHFKFRQVANDNNDMDIFYNGVRVFHDATTRGTGYEYSGNVDLYDPSSWDDFIGAWATSTSYNTNDVVSNDGSYYAADTGHTSSASDEPGVGASWESFWTRWDNPTVGTYATIYLVTNFAGSPEFVADYILEADSTTL